MDEGESPKTTTTTTTTSAHATKITPTLFHTDAHMGTSDRTAPATKHDTATMTKEKQEKEIAIEELEEQMENSKLSGMPEIGDQVMNDLFVTKHEPEATTMVTPILSSLHPTEDLKEPSDGITSASTPAPTTIVTSPVLSPTPPTPTTLSSTPITSVAPGEIMEQVTNN
jgi:hypothetical protein